MTQIQIGSFTFIEDYHKGKIHVLRSIKNEGTTMEIILPLVS